MVFHKLLSQNGGSLLHLCRTLLTRSFSSYLAVAKSPEFTEILNRFRKGDAFLPDLVAYIRRVSLDSAPYSKPMLCQLTLMTDLSNVTLPADVDIRRDDPAPPVVVDVDCNHDGTGYKVFEYEAAYHAGTEWVMTSGHSSMTEARYYLEMAQDKSAALLYSLSPLLFALMELCSGKDLDAYFSTQLRSAQRNWFFYPVFESSALSDTLKDPSFRKCATPLLSSPDSHLSRFSTRILNDVMRHTVFSPQNSAYVHLFNELLHLIATAYVFVSAGEGRPPVIYDPIDFDDGESVATVRHKMSRVDCDRAVYCDHRGGACVNMSLGVTPHHIARYGAIAPLEWVVNRHDTHYAPGRTFLNTKLANRLCLQVTSGDILNPDCVIVHQVHDRDALGYILRAYFGKPLILKVSDSLESRGVFLAEKPAEFDDAFQSACDQVVDDGVPDRGSSPLLVESLVSSPRGLAKERFFFSMPVSQTLGGYGMVSQTKSQYWSQGGRYLVYQSDELDHQHSLFYVLQQTATVDTIKLLTALFDHSNPQVSLMGLQVLLEMSRCPGDLEALWAQFSESQKGVVSKGAMKLNYMWGRDLGTDLRGLCTFLQSGRV